MGFPISHQKRLPTWRHTKPAPGAGMDRLRAAVPVDDFFDLGEHGRHS